MAHHEEYSVFEGVRSVLVVLSSRAMAYDQSALRNFITRAYSGAAVCFISTSGDPVGVEGPYSVDLVIDFTPPGARQGFFFGRTLRKRGKYAVGRKSGWFGRGAYDRLYDDRQDQHQPKHYIDGERWAQRKVLELAGAPVVQEGGVTPDQSKEIALELPPMAHT